MFYRTIDLCAGIGGIRRGFELTGYYKNVLSAEIDQYACATYKHLFGDDAFNDLTSEEFKLKLEQMRYDVLLAGFPCQTFSRAGLEAGFNDTTKGTIFYHIADIIKRTRPQAVFLENVDNLVRHDNGNTFKTIIDTLEIDLDYKVIGVEYDENNELSYKWRDFVRNSKNFGIPQNRPRTYIIAFDRKRFGKRVNDLNTTIPIKSETLIYSDLNDVLDRNVAPKYYMSSGYLETLEKHREREHKKGNGFGYRIVNDKNIEKPIANTLLATGGSGKERNLIYDPHPEVYGLKCSSKKTPINNKGIRVMTPDEWGKLQGFINYAFIRNGHDEFSFPGNMADAQKYKQFGNSVTIPVIQTMAEFMEKCFVKLYE
ncbi:MAG: DNA (cytosine-5-)-methyltransferase [Clostridia bacterium]|nr:DNA (cytosine-5-)-methyltransferase [Clostridia bacterium]